MDFNRLLRTSTNFYECRRISSCRFYHFLPGLQSVVFILHFTPSLHFPLSLHFLPLVRSPQSAVRSPQSAVRSPQSAVRSPQSTALPRSVSRPQAVQICFSAHSQLQPRPQGLLAFQYGGGSGEDPGTQQITCLQRGWSCIQNGGYGEKGEKNWVRDAKVKINKMAEKTEVQFKKK